MKAIYEARKFKSKQPSSLTLEQEERARFRFYQNRTLYKKDEQKTVIDIVNVDCNGLINNGIYTRYKKLLQQQERQAAKEKESATNGKPTWTDMSKLSSK